MRKSIAVSMERTLRQIGGYVRSESKAKGTCTSKRSADGRVTKVRVSPLGAVTLEITMGTLELYGSWNGRNKLVFWGYGISTSTMGAKKREIVDEQVLYLIRESLKRTHPEYRKVPELERKATLRPVVRMDDHGVTKYR